MRLLLLFAVLLLAAPVVADEVKTAQVPEDHSATQTIGAFFESLWGWLEPTHYGMGYAFAAADQGGRVELLSYEFARKPGWGSLFADGYFDPGPSGGGISAGPEAIKPVFGGIGVYRERFVAVAGVHLAF